MATPGVATTEMATTDVVYTGAAHGPARGPFGSKGRPDRGVDVDLPADRSSARPRATTALHDTPVARCHPGCASGCTSGWAA
jgi:hypothetical protein